MMPRRGYKVCECGLEVGVRTKKCPDCGHTFQAKKATKTTAERQRTELRTGGRLGVTPVDVTVPTPPVFKKLKAGAVPPPPSLKKTARLKVQLKDPQAVGKFIVDLKDCLKSAKHYGGAYSAFVVTRDGGKLEVEIWVQ